MDESMRDFTSSPSHAELAVKVGDIMEHFMSPTHDRLAILAATIATGNEVTEEDFVRLGERALSIWWGAARALKARKDRCEILQRERIRQEAKNPPPSPFHRDHETAFNRAGIKPPKGRYDYTLTKALSDVMPKKANADRVKAFRDYVKWLCESGSDLLISLSADKGGMTCNDATGSINQDTESAMAGFRARGFDYRQFKLFAENFLPWLESHTKRKRSEAGRAGGKARSTKAKMKNPRKSPDR